MTNKIQNPNDKIGENRMVFATAKPEAPAAAAEKPDIGLTALNEDIARDPDKLSESIRRLSASWEKLGKSFDSLAKLFEPLGVDEEELEATLREPGANPDVAEVDKAAEENPPEEQTKPPEGIDRKDFAHAKHAADKLSQNPSWKDCIEKASAKYDIPKSALIGIMKMESGLNSKSKAIGASAEGLGQIMPNTFARYKKSSEALNGDRSDPETAIDCVAWVCRNNINSVNNNPTCEAKYKLKATDVANLWLAYNNGAKGYIVLRRYMDNPTQKNFAKLYPFQKSTRFKNGQKIFRWQASVEYSKRVASVAQAYAVNFENSDFKQTA